jgi:hypothetical protein
MRGKHIIQRLFDAAAWFVVAIAVLTFVLRLRSESENFRAAQRNTTGKSAKKAELRSSAAKTSAEPIDLVA